MQALLLRQNDEMPGSTCVNPSALPKTKKPEFLIPEQSLGSVQTLPKFMVSAN